MSYRIVALIPRPSGLFAAATVVAALTLVSGAHAQTAGSNSGGFLSDLFGAGDTAKSGRGNRVAQLSDTDIVVRLDRMENQIRQLTGAIEQLQFRNQQLEQALRRMQGDTDPRLRQQTGRVGSLPEEQPPTRPQPSGVTAPPSGPAPSARRSDVFDPSQHPNAPGVPRALGSGAPIIDPEPGSVAPPPGIGAPGGRQAGEPLDLSTLAAAAAGGTPAASDATGAPHGSVGVGGGSTSGPGQLPPPPPRNPSATGAQAAVSPPSQSAKDEYDLAYGYLLRKDYALAENAFRTFLSHHAGHRLVPDATYWLGESMYQRQRYRDAAESFLAVTTKHEQSAKAPDALYRLGQALAAMGEKEAACAALSEVARKYPRASASVKQGVGREQKRVQC